MSALIATFERGAIVRVPFPYTDGERTQNRPALVVSQAGTGPDHALLWVVMITSAENRRWPDDVPLEADPEKFGLTAPSLIRPAKIATLDAALATPLGRLADERLARVLATVRATLA